MEEDIILDDESRPTDKPGTIRRYGALWHPLHAYLGCDPAAIAKVPPHIQLMWHEFLIEKYILNTKEKFKGYQGFTHHFMRMVDLIWGDPEWKFRFTWNPNAVRMLESAQLYDRLAIAGSASSGKSQFGAVWGFANWILAPDVTKVFYTSTTMLDSESRIWGDVKRLWDKWCDFWGPFEVYRNGKLLGSRYAIVSTSKEKTFKAGLQLVAGAKGHDKDAASKIGFKASRVILIGDELPLLSDELYNATANLSSNEYFQFIGIGNPTSYYDPFGKFSEPVNGWGSVTEADLEWETKTGGKCIRFDGKLSPNVMAGKTIYPGLLTLEKYQWYVEQYGENSLQFWQMCRGWFSPIGRTDAIYWETDFETYRATRKVMEWLDTPTILASLDPSFSHGGDGAPATFFKLGTARLPDGDRMVMEVIDQVDYSKRADKDRNKSEEVARLFHEDLVKRGIPPRNVAVDVSGGGAPFAALLASKLGYGFLEVNFGGKAGSAPVGPSDPKEAVTRYMNKVTELWFSGKTYLRKQQLAGLTPDIITQLCARDYKNIGKGVVQVEPKEQMKKRTAGRSPDNADSWVIGIELARQRFHFRASETAPKAKKEIKWDYERNQPVQKRGAIKLYEDLNYESAGWGSKRTLGETAA